MRGYNKMDIEAYEDVVQQLEHELTMLEAELEMTDQIINDLQSENESLIDEVLELESEYDSLVEGLDEYQDDQLTLDRYEENIAELEVLWGNIVSKVFAGEKVTILDISKIDEIIHTMIKG